MNPLDLIDVGSGDRSATARAPSIGERGRTTPGEGPYARSLRRTLDSREPTAPAPSVDRARSTTVEPTRREVSAAPTAEPQSGRRSSSNEGVGSARDVGSEERLTPAAASSASTSTHAVVVDVIADSAEDSAAGVTSIAELVGAIVVSPGTIESIESTPPEGTPPLGFQPFDAAVDSIELPPTFEEIAEDDTAVPVANAATVAPRPPRSLFRAEVPASDTPPAGAPTNGADATFPAEELLPTSLDVSREESTARAADETESGGRLQPSPTAPASGKSSSLTSFATGSADASTESGGAGTIESTDDGVGLVNAPSASRPAPSSLRDESAENGAQVASGERDIQESRPHARDANRFRSPPVFGAALPSIDPRASAGALLDVEATIDPPKHGEEATKLEAIDRPGAGESAGTRIATTAARAGGSAPVSEFATLSARGAARASTPEAAENAEAILQGVREGLSSGRQLRIRLNPPELGSLQIEIVRRDGALVARLSVDNPAAHRTVLEHANGLGEQLARQGHVLDRIDVELHERSRDDGRENREGRSDDGQRRDGEPRRERRPPRDEAERSSTTNENEHDRVPKSADVDLHV